MAAALGTARAAAALGGDVSVALRGSGSRPALAKLAAGWRLSDDCGAPLADLVEQVAADVRADADVRRQTRIELTGARATGLVLAVLPLLGVGLGAAMGADPLRVLLHTPAGSVCAFVGIGFEAAGVAWVRRLTRGG
ncbi:MAG: type II secretion system F family protein [Mycobacteriales bacterium]